MAVARTAGVMTAARTAGVTAGMTAHGRVNINHYNGAGGAGQGLCIIAGVSLRRPPEVKYTNRTYLRSIAQVWAQSHRSGLNRTCLVIAQNTGVKYTGQPLGCCNCVQSG
jgi:hypothetical protein